MEIIIIINKKLYIYIYIYIYIISFIFFPYFHHKNNGNIHKLVFNKEKYRFVVEYKVITLTL